MSSVNRTLIEIALDQYVHDYGTEPFRAAELAQYVGYDRWIVSDMLQQYRLGQKAGKTRYVVQSRGYGRAARWHVSYRQKGDTTVLQRDRVRGAIHSVQDAVKRLVSDVVHEVVPAGRRGTGQDQLIQRDVNMIVATMTAQVEQLVKNLNP